MAVLLAGCVPVGVTGAEAPALMQYPVKVEQAASGTQAALTLSVQAAPLAGYRTQYVNVLDWEQADATLSNADASIPSLSRTAAVSVSAELARSATLEFAPIKPAGGYTLTIALKRRDRAGVYQTVATGIKAGFALSAGANNATVAFAPTASGQLQVSVPQPAPSFTPPPRIDGFHPTTGSAGMLTELSGAHFAATPAANLVTFNGTAAGVSAVSTGSLWAEVPSGATSGPIAVTVRGSTATSAANFTPVVTGTALGAFGTGAGPDGVAMAPSGHMWVANARGTSVTKLAADGSWVGTYFANSAPAAIAIDATGVVWVTNLGPTGKVTRLAADGTLLTTTTVGTNATDIALDGAGNAWVACFGSSNVYRLAPDGTISGTFPVWGGTANCAGVTCDPAGNAWVTLNDRNVIARVTPAGTVTTYPVGSKPFGIMHDPAANVLWVALEADGKVAKVAMTGAVSASYNCNPAPRNLTVDPQGNVWVCNWAQEQVTKVSAAGAILFSQTFGATPMTVAFDRHRAAWVTQDDSNSVLRLAL
jgi:streptogramin lyase